RQRISFLHAQPCRSELRHSPHPGPAAAQPRRGRRGGCGMSTALLRRQHHGDAAPRPCAGALAPTVRATRIEALRRQLACRVLVIDGALGTMIQNQGLDESGYRGSRFADHPCPQKGNNDLLILSQPDLIRDIHRAYFEAGADIAETNTFSSTRIAQGDYMME